MAMTTALAITVCPLTRAQATEANRPVQLILPEPTGPHRIGTVSLHLIDRTRTDPFVPASGRGKSWSNCGPGRPDGGLSNRTVAVRRRGTAF